ncbi:uncharacterized protein [Primulina eburnea]|uniref:uncharacterized protein n=1 Tax=Primulina eburnea TaxID=1245227 RepID=UPI003C6C35D2
MWPPAQPPSSPDEIGFYWTDEQIFLFLDGYTPGVCLPKNVLADSIPYLYWPADLPEGIWYLVQSNEKKESVLGFWKLKGQACGIYSNSVINGWRSTLEYYEGEAPHAQRTDWVMQEYSITQKELLSEKNNPEEFTLLCRVFHCNGNQINETYTEGCKNTVELQDVSSRASNIPKTDNNLKQDSKSESKANSSPQEIADFKCFLREDFLELNDLEGPASHSSSSQNSSCPSKLSDECFDSLALLRELDQEGDIADAEGKNLISGYSISTSVKSNDVIFVPPTSGSIFTGAASTSKNEPLTDEHMLEHSTKRDASETRDESNSNFSDANTRALLNRVKKENDAGRKKIRLKQYFCFAYF